MKILHMLFLLTILQASNLFGAEEIDFESRKYKVIHASGSFGTFGHIAQGDILEFNPRKLMAAKPGFINFEKREETKVEIGEAYLGLAEGNFELSETNINKYQKFKSYSFVSKDDLEKTRFDVIFDNSMVITYESKGIIYGVVVLDIVKAEASKEGAEQPATRTEEDSKRGDKPEPE